MDIGCIATIINNSTLFLGLLLCACVRACVLHSWLLSDVNVDYKSGSASVGRFIADMQRMRAVRAYKKIQRQEKIEAAKAGKSSQVGCFVSGCTAMAVLPDSIPTTLLGKSSFPSNMTYGKYNVSCR